MLAHAKKLLDANIPQLAAYTDHEMPIIGLEPSEILTLRDEYLDLCDDDQLGAARKVAGNSYTFEEFARQAISENKKSVNAGNKKVYIHGHCHAKSLTGHSAIREVLQQSGYETEVLDTGCCGMAGSFGYEEDHYQVSMDIAELRLFPALRKLPKDAIICAPGFSCRHQIADGFQRKAYHPAVLLARALA
jgi:Fe-S oxidoreductase